MFLNGKKIGYKYYFWMWNKFLFEIKNTAIKKNYFISKFFFPAAVRT